MHDKIEVGLPNGKPRTFELDRSAQVSAENFFKAKPSAKRDLLLLHPPPLALTSDHPLKLTWQFQKCPL